MTNAALRGKSDAGKPHVRFDEGKVAPVAIQNILKACLPIIAAVSSTYAGGIVYENDFSTRESVGAVPSGEWREIRYSVGRLANVNSTSETDGAFGGDAIQDNWIKGLNVCEANVSVIDDDGNPMALAFCSGTKVSHVVLKQRLGNAFTTGVVTAQCDIKPPSSWEDYSSRAVRLYLGDEDFFSPETGSDTYLSHVAAGAGISYHADTSTYRFWQYGATLVNQQVSSQGGSGWFRVVLSANLGTKTFDVSVYELGEEHPTLDTPTPGTPAYTASGCNFYSETKASGLSSISAIGISGYGVSGTTNATDRAKTAQFDNLRVWHDGVEFYGNDFATRRSQRLAAGANTFEYAAATLVTNAFKYAENSVLSLPLEGSQSDQPVGVDGWRRVNGAENNQIDLKVVAYTNNNAAVLDWEGKTSESGYGLFGNIAQPLGRTFTDGRVRFCADILVSSLADSGNAYMFLGNDTLYSAGTDGYLNGIFARFGIDAETDGVDANGKAMRKPSYYSSDNGTGVNRKATKASGISIAGRWIRMEMTADIDAKTYDLAIYNVCPSSQSPTFGMAAGECLFSTNGIWRANAVENISCIALSCNYGHVYYDNLQVWHSSSGSLAETLVYSNTFSARKVYLQDCHYDRLVGTINKNPEGMDGWTRLGRASKDILLVDEGSNAAIAFADNNTENASWAVHDLGMSFNLGKAMASFDLLAPSEWANAAGHAAVWLGGGQFREGNLSGGQYGFEKWAVCGAGISNSVFAAWSGDDSGGGAWTTSGAATAGHWYRFVMKASLERGTSDVSVYDMGTEQPALSAALPAVAAATFEALPHRRSLSQARSVSCIAVEAYGVSNGSVLKGDARLMVGNLRIEHKPSGFTVFVR